MKSYYSPLLLLLTFLFIITLFGNVRGKDIIIISNGNPISLRQTLLLSKYIYSKENQQKEEEEEITQLILILPNQFNTNEEDSFIPVKLGVKMREVFKKVIYVDKDYEIYKKMYNFRTTFFSYFSYMLPLFFRSKLSNSMDVIINSVYSLYIYPQIDDIIGERKDQVDIVFSDMAFPSIVNICRKYRVKHALLSNSIQPSVWETRSHFTFPSYNAGFGNRKNTTSTDRALTALVNILNKGEVMFMHRMIHFFTYIYFDLIQQRGGSSELSDYYGSDIFEYTNLPIFQSTCCSYTDDIFLDGLRNIYRFGDFYTMRRKMNETLGEKLEIKGNNNVDLIFIQLGWEGMKDFNEKFLNWMREIVLKYIENDQNNKENKKKWGIIWNLPKSYHHGKENDMEIFISDYYITSTMLSKYDHIKVVISNCNDLDSYSISKGKSGVKNEKKYKEKGERK